MNKTIGQVSGKFSEEQIDKMVDAIMRNLKVDECDDGLFRFILSEAAATMPTCEFARFVERLFTQEVAA